jgi:hypothetical protein
MTGFLWALLAATAAALSVRVAAWGLAWHETTTVAVFGLLGTIVAMLGGLGVALISTHRKAGAAHVAAEESQKVVVEIHLVNNRMDRMEAALAAAALYQAELVAAVTAVGGVVPEPTQAVVLLPPAAEGD